MPQTSIDTQAASQYAIIACISWGDSSEVRLARWADDITVDEIVYSSEPTLEVDLGLQHAGLNDKPTYLKVRSDIEPFATAINGYAHAPINVTIYQLDPADPDNTARRLFEGQISEITKNSGGVKGLVKCKIPSKKAMLDISLGLFTTPSCQWRFGDPNTCRKTRPEFTATVVSTSDPNNVSLEISGGSLDSTYRRGWVEVDGLRVMIRAVRSSTLVELVRVPPPRWVGESIRFVAGCDKQLSTCRDEWDNEANYMAPGYTIPPYNPIVTGQ